MQEQIAAIVVVMFCGVDERKKVMNVKLFMRTMCCLGLACSIAGYNVASAGCDGCIGGPTNQKKCTGTATGSGTCTISRNGVCVSGSNGGCESGCKCSSADVAGGACACSVVTAVQDPPE